TPLGQRPLVRPPWTAAGRSTVARRSAVARAGVGRHAFGRAESAPRASGRAVATAAATRFCIADERIFAEARARQGASAAADVARCVETLRAGRCAAGERQARVLRAADAGKRN